MEQEKLVIRIEHKSNPIFGHWSEKHNFLEIVLKAAVQPEFSNLDANPGLKVHPLNFIEILRLRNANPYHSTCLQTKKQAAVGLGFMTEASKKKREEKKKLQEQGVQFNPGGVQPPQKPKGVNKESSDEDSSKVSKILDALCTVSFQDVIDDVIDEFYQVGNGFIEVVRDGPGGSILGLHHIPAHQIFIHVLEDYTTFYEVVNGSEPGGFASGSFSRIFAPFGKSKEIEAIEEARNIKLHRGPIGQVSEVIHFRKPSSLSRWYGFPDWLSVVPGVEVSQKLRQFQHDFFDNRAVPEFALFITGAQLDPEVYKKLEDTFKSGIGLGNSHKSAIINLDAPNINIQMERLSSDTSSDNAQAGLTTSLALEIVTGHRVPPLLAGIQVPGKLGAANEMVSTMKAFQSLVIGPDQHNIRTTLSRTLGNAALNGGLGLTEDDMELRKITDEMEVEQLDTVSRMRQDVNAPQNKDRDPNEGLKD